MKTDAFFVLCAVLLLMCHVSAFVRHRESSYEPRLQAIATANSRHRLAAFDVSCRRAGNVVASSPDTIISTRKNQQRINNKDKRQNKNQSRSLAEWFGDSLSFHGGLITVV
eukprot:scaffold9890_cov159-Amphora_coffeaeformis.AAC.2